jgi:hypothetical protein
VGENESCWLNYHLYYHQALSSAVDGFVRPLVAGLLRSGWIDHFFFIRYWLGGPHIRLRLRPRSGASALVTEAAETRARDFLASWPSTSKLDREAILRFNKQVLANDAHELDDSIYPDNSLLAFPFRPEIERYGGPELWRDSLDFFVVSSATALELLGVYGGEPRSRQLAIAFRVLTYQALSFARDEDDLIALARYAVDLWGGKMPRVLAKADRVLAEQRRTFDRLFERELYLLEARPAAVVGVGEEAKAQLGEAARRLAWIVRAAGRDVRQRIGTSQLHMTANRLGLSNAEEVYLSRILASLASDFTASGKVLGIRPAAGEASLLPLGDLVPTALARIVEAEFHP